MPRTTLLRRAFVAAAAGAAVALSAAPAGAAEQPTQLPCIAGVTCSEEPPKCANRDVEPARGNLGIVSRATLCLLNQERAERGLPRFRANRPLRRVASRYARSMVKLSFFDHVSPLGSTFAERIKRSAYLAGADGYSLGENLAWGAGPMSTPRRIVRAWMLSPGHRANILNDNFRDIGMGVAFGIPIAGGGPGATYVNEFGTRS